jgi:fibronectin-binding autotransporter adhesin
MASLQIRHEGSRRKSAVRARMIALSAAVAGVVGVKHGQANITGFAGFAAANSNIGDTNLGYQSSNTAFLLTDSQNSEATSGFNIIPQSISGGFVATYDYVGTGSADGVTLAFLNPAVGSTTTLGNTGGSLGYAGSGSNSAAVGIEGYGSSAAEFTNGGNEQTSGLGGGINVFSGDTYHVTDVYSGSTFTQNIVDLTTGAAGSQKTYNLSLATTLGSSTALVGFTGGTGGLNATQTVKNFSFTTGNLKYSPIAVTGYDQAGIITVAGGTAVVTATMDTGTTKGGDTWFEKGWSTNLPNAGLPTSGSTFVSQEDTNHTFTMPSYAGNDVILLSSTVATGTFNFTTPAAYTALSFLTATGNGPGVFNATVNYANGKSSTDQVLVSPDWFNGQPSAFSAGGRATLATTANNAENDGTNPNLYQDDVFLTDTTDPISSVTFNYNRGGGVMIFAVSGSATNLSPVLTYTGNQSAGVFDSTHYNFYNGTNTNFSNGSIVLFDDTSANTTANRTISVASGLSIGGLTFNNSTATLPYIFTGSGLGGIGGVTMNGNGTVIFDNPNTFTGDTDLEAGQLVIGSGGTFNSSNIFVATGATLNVSGGTLTNATINLTNYGTVDYSGSTLSLAGFNGSGPFTSTNTTGTSLTFTGGGNYSGTLSLGAGSVIMNGNASTMTLTGTNTYTGGTYLQSGTLLVASSGSLGTGTIFAQNGSIGASTAAVNLSNLISGGALIANSGGNLLELSNSANNFTGPIVVQSGTLQMDAPGTIGGTTSIIVASGATFLVNDNSGNAGLGTTMQLNGTGVGSQNPTPLLNGPVGALRGADNSTDTWAGNINVSSPSYIAAGANGILTLTGSISGGPAGTVAFTNNATQSVGALIVLAPSGTNANTYSGETQIIPGPQSSSYGQVLQLGATNGISPNSGLNFLSGSAQIVNVDLNGYDQTLTYLTGGAQTGYALTSGTVPGDNSGPSTLTITSGLKAGVPTFMGTAITGNIAVVMNDPTGLGNQYISGANSYTGNTTITKGTLTAFNHTAFSTGTVMLNGGTLALGSVGSISGVSQFVGTQGTGSGGTTVPTISNGVLTMTSGVTNTANAAYYPVPVPVSDATGFTASFTYSIPNGYADGLGFVLQNDPRGLGAVGAGGGYLAYGSATGGISKSAAVLFNLYDNTAGIGTAYQTSGNVPGQPSNPTGVFTPTGDVVLALQLNTSNNTYYILNPETVNVTLTYNGPAQTLTETLVNAAMNTSFSTVFTGVDYSAAVGGPAGGTTTAYVGFVAATGAVTSTQTISNFNYSSGLSTSPQSIGNAIVAVAGTSSAIQLSVAANSLSSGAAVGSVTVNSGATLAVTTTGGSATVRGVLQPASLSIATTGKLDLGPNDLDLAAGGLTVGQVTAMVASGYNKGSWSGTGIASSAAAADSTHLTALGVLVNDTTANTTGSLSGTALYSTLDGAAVADGDILVKYTYYGDTNLDGKVDGTDYSRLDNGYLSHLSGWANGDFNYDGVINGSDYTLIDNAYNTQGASLNEAAAQIGSPTAQLAGSASAVPEPATLGLISIGAMGLLSRRRRRI